MTNTNTYLRKNISLAWPLGLNALLVQSMLLIDTLLVAPLGELPVAALGLSTALLACALGTQTAIGNGIQLLVGRAFGSKSQADLAVAYWVGMFINATASLLFFFVLGFFDKQLITLLTNDLELIQLSVSYLEITKYIILLTTYTQVCTSFSNGRGKTKIPLRGYMIEVPVNVILSYTLINGFGDFTGLGITGAAWGSLVAVLLRTLYFYLIMKFDKGVDLGYPKSRPFWQELGPQSSEIIPIAANFFVLFIGATFYQLLFSQLDLYAFVAITLIFPWFRIGTQFIAAWAHASAINVSQTLGQKNFEELNAFIPACLKAVLVLTVAVGVVFFILSQNILLIYPDIEPETQTALAVIAPLYILLPIVRGFNSVTANILRALGESQRALKINFIAQWMITLPLLALMILYFEVSVFWAFAMMMFEELLKPIFFLRYTQMRLKQIMEAAA